MPTLTLGVEERRRSTINWNENDEIIRIILLYIFIYFIGGGPQVHNGM
jgi:hypothetical protein